MAILHAGSHSIDLDKSNILSIWDIGAAVDDHHHVPSSSTAGCPCHDQHESTQHRNLPQNSLATLEEKEKIDRCVGCSIQEVGYNLGTKAEEPELEGPKKDEDLEAASNRRPVSIVPNYQRAIGYQWQLERRAGCDGKGVRKIDSRPIGTRNLRSSLHLHLCRYSYT